MVQQQASWDRPRLLWAGAIVVALWVAPRGAPMPSFTPATGRWFSSFPKIQKATKAVRFFCCLALKLGCDQPALLMLHIDGRVCSVQIPHGSSLSPRSHLCWICTGPEHSLGIIQCCLCTEHTPWHGFWLSDCGQTLVRPPRWTGEEVSDIGIQAPSCCLLLGLVSSPGLLYLLVQL